jgi:hypothetical protein
MNAAKTIMRLPKLSFRIVRFAPEIDMFNAAVHVRFGSKADMCGATTHVCITPQSDRESCRATQSEIAGWPSAKMLPT